MKRGRLANTGITGNEDKWRGILALLDDRLKVQILARRREKGTARGETSFRPRLCPFRFTATLLAHVSRRARFRPQNWSRSFLAR